MTPETLPMLFTVFAWSCNALLTGITPEEDWNQIPLGRGEFIAEKWRASMVQLRGDWEFYANALSFANWATGPRMCWQCLD